MALKPWYDVVKPREDLAKGRPLDASEFAVHLDQVRDGTAASVYRDPKEFFDRTYITAGLRQLSVEVLRRLSGNKVNTSPIFNLITNFGGGKTHSLLVLYHLARAGADAPNLKGLPALLQEAELKSAPSAAVAVFVGTEFDAITGRGKPGEPLRRTPWGEIAFQLGGAAGYALVAEHEEKLVAPGGDVIEKLIPKDKPTLILLDEFMNYMSRARAVGKGLDSQVYSFVQNLCGVVAGRDNAVLAGALPSSLQTELPPEDHENYTRLKNILARNGKAVTMSAGAETSEIIRRRLFMWEGLTKEASQAVSEYGSWVSDHKGLLPAQFNLDDAQAVFRNTYPFHPTVLSVFERKWQTLPVFQRTRGVLRLLALWVSHVYKDGYSNPLSKEPLITLGTAPMSDPNFRQAVFEQLGADQLEAAVTTDISGSMSAHAMRLDKEATPAVKKARLHEKIATAVFFESNGGQASAVCTEPEVRIAVGQPDVEQCLGALVENCYYLTSEKKNYRFSFTPNLNKLLSDKRATVHEKDIDDRMRAEVQQVFTPGGFFKMVFFPDESGKVPDQPTLALAVLPPDQPSNDKSTEKLIDALLKENGSKSRTHKSGVLISAAESSSMLRDEARKLLAWERIADDQEVLKLNEAQQKQVGEQIQKAKRDLKEAVWRSYRHVYLLGSDQKASRIDLGLVHSNAAGMQKLVVDHLVKSDLLLDKAASPTQLTKNWPPASPEWSTKSVRDMFYASPLLPRLLKPELARETIVRGVKEGFFAYVGKTSDGGYHPFHFKVDLTEVDFVEDIFILGRDASEAYAKNRCPKCESSPPSWNSVDGVCGNCGHGQKAACPNCKAQAPKWDAAKNACESCGYGTKAQCPSCKSTGAQWHAESGQCDSCGFGKAKVECPTCGAKPPTWNAETKKCGHCATPSKPKSLHWTGEVSHQKWMQFYTKVLSKFATAGGMKITVVVDIEPSGGVSPERVSETRGALKELGMPDDVETKE